MSCEMKPEPRRAARAATAPSRSRAMPGNWWLRADGALPQCRGRTRRAPPEHSSGVEEKRSKCGSLIRIDPVGRLQARRRRRPSRTSPTRPRWCPRRRAGQARSRPAPCARRRPRASGSYSTSTRSAASRATSRVRATTATTGSPTCRTLPTASAKSLIWFAGRRRELEERVGLGGDLVAASACRRRRRAPPPSRRRSRRCCACAYGERTKWT